MLRQILKATIPYSKVNCNVQVSAYSTQKIVGKNIKKKVRN